MTTAIVMAYASGVRDQTSQRLDEFLQLRGRSSSYTKSGETPWQKEHSKLTTGSDNPITFRELSIADRTARIRALIAKGLGDGSIAVRLNNEGVSCSRAEVYRVRTGREPPDGQGGFDEVSFNSPS